MFNLKSEKDRLRTLNIIYLRKKFNKFIIKYQSYPQSAKMDAFEQKICKCHSPAHESLGWEC